LNFAIERWHGRIRPISVLLRVLVFLVVHMVVLLLVQLLVQKHAHHLCNDVWLLRCH
jgi:hypothetical protein